jgi:serine/threonine-protein kinase
MSEAPKLLGGRYEVGRLIGRGGMAEVHLGHDMRLDRQVAIKMLRSDLARDPSFLTRFRREATSAAGLNHAAIVAVYDSGEDHSTDFGGASVDVPYIVMEYVEGRTLREVLNDKGRYEPAEAARITEGVLDALAYSHRKGIVHRDIKPANVMIGADGAVKVMDFGIARAIADSNATMTQTQAVIGTAQYLSPEQAQGQAVDHRSDLYSTGCMLFELLTGRPPFTGDTPVSIAYQHVGEAPVPPSRLVGGITPEFDAVVLHSLGKDRETRYQDAVSFRSDLRSVRLGWPISAEALGAVDELALDGLAVAGAAGAVGAGGGAAGGPTEQMGTIGAEPTEVYTPVTSPPEPPLLPQPVDAYPSRADFRDERRSNRAVWITVAVVLVLGLFGFGLKTYIDRQAAARNMVSVPSVVSKPEEVATAELTKAGLRFTVSREASDTADAGTVIAQDPAAGTDVQKNEIVAITVSTGPNNVAIPDLEGKTVDQATLILGQLKLQVGKITQVDDSKLDKGQIISSSPAADSLVAPGTSVALNVSSGRVTVPNVLGMIQNDALSTLAEAGLVPKTEYQEQAGVQEGTVIKQDPSKGKADRGSTVTIVVAQAPASTPTPTPSDSPSPTPTPTP